MSRILLLCLFIVCGCQSYRLVQKPLDFTEKRQKLTRIYRKEHYGDPSPDIYIKPQMVVVHWTAIPTFEGSYRAFAADTLPGARADIATAGNLNVSAHYLVDRDGTVYQLMPDTVMARHVIGLNYCAIGIENVGGTENTPLTKKQLKANAGLIRDLKKTYPIRYVIGHYEYTSFEDNPLWKEKDDHYRTEKTDPGESFMRKLRKRL